jgi:hypothetical protein
MWSIYTKTISFHNLFYINDDGFSRGIRCGWFDNDTRPYRIAAEKAWHALEKYSIDKDGNIHGVCRGSEFAFNPRYSGDIFCLV